MTSNRHAEGGSNVTPLRAPAAGIVTSKELAKAVRLDDAMKVNFEVRASGVYLVPKEDGGSDQWICSPLHVVAKTRDGSGNDWGLLLEWRDADGKLHRWAMPMSMLAGDGADFRAELLRGGLTLASGRAKHQIIDYVQSAQVIPRALCVSSTGWRGQRFVLPDATIGDQGEEVIFQSTSAGQAAISTAGSLEAWREFVAGPAAGNSRMMFGIACAFAPPLLELIGEDGGGFHLSGGSSSGKTTALELAASVWGPPKSFVRKWRSTANGLEGVATMHNDLLLVLDEIGQADAKEIGESVYMLANGMGKQRASKDGCARPAKQWKLLWLSAGECGLSDLMRTGGKRAMAGQEIRLANIPADAGKGLGAFETLSGEADGAALSRRLKDAAGANYGCAGREYLAKIVKNRDQLAKDLVRLRTMFVSEHLPSAASGQVARVLSRFAIVALAGELATRLGITGWNEGEAAAATAICFRAWVNERGGSGSAEDSALLDQVRGFFEAHGSSRFESLDHGCNAYGDIADRKPVINRAGFVRKANGSLEFIVAGSAFKAELAAGFNATQAAKVLIDRGWLVPEKDGTPQMRVLVPGLGRARYYVFRAAAMGCE